MNRAAEVRRTAPSVPGYTRWEPQKNRDRGEQEKVQRNNGCKVSKFNKKCKSAHSEISINSTQDQDREGHSQVQFSKNAEKDRDSLQSSNWKTAYHKEISKKLTATSHQKQQKPECSGKTHPKFSKPLLTTTTKKTQTISNDNPIHSKSSLQTGKQSNIIPRWTKIEWPHC